MNTLWPLESLIVRGPEDTVFIFTRTRSILTAARLRDRDQAARAPGAWVTVARAGYPHGLLCHGNRIPSRTRHPRPARFPFSWPRRRAGTRAPWVQIGAPGMLEGVPQGQGKGERRLCVLPGARSKRPTLLDKAWLRADWPSSTEAASCRDGNLTHSHWQWGAWALHRLPTCYC